jgi:uroporphyrinogen III methyltransferase/synthase
LLVLRAAHQADETARAISERGAVPVVASAIAIAKPVDNSAVLAAARRLEDYDWVLFTSPNGVDGFVQALTEAGESPRALGQRHLGVIGPGTQEALARHGLRAELMASPFTGEGLARRLLDHVRPKRVLIPRARVANRALPEILEQAGVVVDVISTYETQSLSPEQRAVLSQALAKGVDAVLLTSSSTAQAVAELLREGEVAVTPGVVMAAIGPVTQAAAERLGLRVDVVAAEHTIPGLLDALAAHFSC